MRYGALLLAVLVAALTFGLVVPAEAAQSASGRLTLTAIEWLPETVHANEEVVFAVTYAKSANFDQIPKIQLKIEANQESSPAEDDDIATQFCTTTEEIPEAVDLGIEASNTHRFAPCFIPEDGEYTVTAALLVDDGNTIEASLSVGPEQTALPGEFGRLFAGLGMFAAIMVIVALGTEVLIDSLKVLLGMKTKVTSMEAIAQMEKLLPGQLASLGVSAETQQEFQEVSKNLNKTLQSFYTPLQEAIKIKAALQKGQLGTAYTALVALETALKDNQSTPSHLAQLRNQAKDAISADLQAIADRLKLPAALKEEAVRLASEQIDAITPDKVDELFTKVAATLNRPDWVSQVTDEWLKGQRDTWLKTGRTQVITRFNEFVKPALESLALDPSTITIAHDRLEAALTSLDVKATLATDTFLNSLEFLLNGVEARRFEMQSPIRKIWRRLRKAKYGALWLALLAAVPVIILPLFGRTFLYLRFDWFTADLPDLVWLLIYYLTSFILVVLFLLFFWWQGKRNLTGAPGYLNPKPKQVSASSKNATPPTSSPILSQEEFDKLTALQVIESYWNRLRGQKGIDPEDFENPPDLWEVLYNKRGARDRLTPETVASIILRRSDQQRDEEASRQRWLRVISVFVGLILAYILQIDAASLLDAAVPGVSNVINSIFNFSGEQLHALWPHFPAGLSLTAGMILTGLAASAGSAFWHDQLERLQATKKGAESAAKILQQTQDMLKG